MEKTMVGAGCFWGVEAAFSQVKGVIATAVGYSGGHGENPSYEEVCTGETGHAEVVQLEYDPSQVSYQDLLQVFWQIHDPTTLNRQGPDVGSQYRSVIFFYNPQQQTEAISSKDELEKKGVFQESIVTEIKPAGPFYRAEEYHQRYLEKRGIASCKH